MWPTFMREDSKRNSLIKREKYKSIKILISLTQTHNTHFTNRKKMKEEKNESMYKSL